MNLKDVATEELKAELVRRRNAALTETLYLLKDGKSGKLTFDVCREDEEPFLYEECTILDKRTLTVADGKMVVSP